MGIALNFQLAYFFRGHEGNYLIAIVFIVSLLGYGAVHKKLDRTNRSAYYWSHAALQHNILRASANGQTDFPDTIFVSLFTGAWHRAIRP
jgi:hypothetical protein